MFVPSPGKDEFILEALRQGDTLGCAQLESPEVRSRLQLLPLRSKAALAAALGALPGSATATQAWEAVAHKHQHPAAFACAVLNHPGGAYPLRTLAADFQRHGVTLLLPSVNASRPECSLEGGAVRIGLSRVKHLQAITIERILERRPFESFAEFIAEVPTSRAELRALVLCGACDGLPPLEPEGYPFAHQDSLSLWAEHRPLHPFVPRKAGGPKAAMWRSLQRIKHEQLYLDMHLTAHPLGVQRSEAQRVGCVTVAELAGLEGRRARFAGLVAASRTDRTEDGRVMQLVTFEDETGLVEAVVAPSRFAEGLPGAWLIEGMVVREQRLTRVEVLEVRPFHERPLTPALSPLAQGEGD